MSTRKSGKNDIRNTRRGTWIWWVVAIIIFGGLAVWGIYAADKSGKTDMTGGFQEPQPQVIATENSNEMRPACAVIEDMLVVGIVGDDDTDWQKQADSAQIYSVLAERGCPENAQFFKDMAQRKQTIADGLRAIMDPNNSIMTSVEYLYSDDRICQTIEKRVIQNINTKAYTYDEFLDNANTYSVLYQFGCHPNKRAYLRAAIRELGVAMALVPPEHMTKEQIVTIMEVYKRMKNADGAHMVLQRLKARGYDMDFLLSMEEIIHGMA